MPEIEVHGTTNGTHAVLPLPESNAHLAPVPPTIEAEGVATTYRNLPARVVEPLRARWQRAGDSGGAGVAEPRPVG